jgi:hypothetical protein
MHFENLLFILLIAMAALLRLLATKAGEAKKGQKAEGESTITPKIGEPIKRVRVESDQERIRKFLEALGQPTTAKPPSPIVPRTGIPPRPVAPVQPPPIPTARNVLARRKKQMVEPTKFLAAAPTFEHHETPPARELPASIKSPVEPYAIDTESKTKVGRIGINVARILRSPTGLRDAIVLREIFGPPRSLQPLDLVGRA